MKWKPFSFVFLVLLFACSEAPADQAATSVEPEVAEESWEGFRDVDGSYRSDGAGFVVRFPSGKVDYERSKMDSKAGDVDYHTYIHSVPGAQDHMVSVSIYPVELVVAKGPSGDVGRCVQGNRSWFGEARS